MKAFRLNFLFLAFFLLSSGCSYKVEKIKNENVLSFEVPSAYLQRSSYAEVSRVFQAKCITCHGTSGGVSLDSYASAKSALPGITRTVFTDKTMPKAPVSGLNQDEFYTLAAWVKLNGPELPSDGTAPIPPTEPTPLEPKFASIKEHILDKKCISCHGPGGKAERVPLSTISDLVDSPLEIVTPGVPDDSGLILVLQPEARKPMPPRDSGMSPVKPEEIKIIEDWIRNGAKD